MIVDAEQLVDHPNDSLEGPEVGGKAMGFGSLDHVLPQRPQLGGVEPAGPAGMGLAGQGARSALAVSLHPAVDGPRLAADHLGDFGRAVAVQDKLNRAQPPTFQFFSCACWSHNTN